MHHPDGMLWIRWRIAATRSHLTRSRSPRSPPTILRLLGMTPPAVDEDRPPVLAPRSERRSYAPQSRRCCGCREERPSSSSSLDFGRTRPNAGLLTRSAVVVVFHRVLRRRRADPIRSASTCSTFETLLPLLQRHFRVVPLSDLVDRLADGPARRTASWPSPSMTAIGTTSTMPRPCSSGSRCPRRSSSSPSGWAPTSCRGGTASEACGIPG